MARRISLDIQCQCVYCLANNDSLQTNDIIKLYNSCYLKGRSILFLLFFLFLFSLPLSLSYIYIYTAYHMAADNIVNTYDSRRSSTGSMNKTSGTFYNGHKVINDPIHVTSVLLSNLFVTHLFF